METPPVLVSDEPKGKVEAENSPKEEESLDLAEAGSAVLVSERSVEKEKAGKSPEAENCVLMVEKLVVVSERSLEKVQDETKNNLEAEKEISIYAFAGSKISTVAKISPATESARENKAKKNRKYIKNRVRVSNNKKPFIFYLNLAKRCLKQCNGVELSGLGMAIPTVVTIAEILKRTGLATEKRIAISSVFSPKEDGKGRPLEKAKIEIFMEKLEKIDGARGTTDTASTLKSGI